MLNTSMLILPIDPSRLADAEMCIVDVLNDFGVGEEDTQPWLEAQINRWEIDGKPTKDLETLFRQILFSDTRLHKTSCFGENLQSNSDVLGASRQLSMKYFEIVSSLQNKFHLDFDASRQVVAYFPLIFILRAFQGCTASEISRLLSVRLASISINWQIIDAILSKLGQSPTLSVEQVKLCYFEDCNSEEEFFGDLNIQDCISLVSQHASQAGLDPRFSKFLNDFLINDLHPPLVCVLHYQLIIQRFYDHAISYAYEFKPRGEPLNWLAEKYNEAGVDVGKSPFLNNAKATLRLDDGWAIGRDKNPQSAAALSFILSQLEALSPVAKSDLSNKIRHLLARFVKLKQSEFLSNDEELRLDSSSIKTLFAEIGQKNTSTNGILEQRYVDVYASLCNPPEDGWKPKGIGDSVFAANIFRKKFGDVEFLGNMDDCPTLNAYESHSGKLTEIYVHDHIHSFSSVLEMRKDELKLVAELNDWTMNLNFVCREVKCPEFVRHIIKISDAEVCLNINYLHFDVLLEKVQNDPKFVSVSQSIFNTYLNDIWTPQRVKQAVQKIVS